MAERKRLLIFRDLILPIGIMVGATLLVTLYRDEIKGLATFGYSGIFIACLAANATVFLPAPSSAIVFAFASIYSPLWVALVGGLGAACGELVGYFGGLSGHRLVESTAIGLKVQKWFSKHAVLTVFVLAFLPIPIFDLAGVLAGASKMKLSVFLPVVSVGKVLKMVIYALLGANIIPGLSAYFNDAWK
ncbi:VTT domain-containing protein [Chloroflexota bacterium]|nr:VTT domain-containing protein [Chloroflexota bacterium]